MQPLFSLLDGIAVLSPEIKQHLEKILHRKTFKRDEYALREGQICRYIYFIETGLVRHYHWIGDREVTTFFLCENDIFISVESFFQQIPSHESIVMLEDTVCWGISFEQLWETCRIHPEFYAHFIQILISYYCKSLARHRDMQCKDGMERYTEFADKRSDLLQRIQLSLIPSYLDVAPSTFNSIRSRYAGKK